MIKNLIKAAADLDAAGFIVEADLMDKIMQKVAAEPNFGFLSQKKSKPAGAKKPAKKKAPVAAEDGNEEDDDEDMLASLQSAAEDGDSEDEDLDGSDEESEYGDDDEPGDISEEDEEDGVTISAQECLEHCLMLSTDEKCALMKALLDSMCEE
jgi:hypothetical protein